MKKLAVLMFLLVFGGNGVSGQIQKGGTKKKPAVVQKKFKGVKNKAIKRGRRLSYQVCYQADVIL